MLRTILPDAAYEADKVPARATRHNAAGSTLLIYLSILICSTVLPAVSRAAPACPGIAPGLSSYTCTTQCQQATCDALADLYKSTNNASASGHSVWVYQSGWEALLVSTCREITAADGTPSYCTWHGVTCCTETLRNIGYCLVIGSVWALELNTNGLMGSVEDPRFESGLAQLHACGLMDLAMQGNSLSGSMTSFWGKLTNLLSLSLSKIARSCRSVPKHSFCCCHMRLGVVCCRSFH